MKIGIYGGSFNPIHFGHLGLVKWVIDHTDLDEIWMLISPNNPLKDSHILADEQERLSALRAALSELNDNRIQASDFEFSLPRPSYTAATLRALREQYPEHEFVLLIGQDNWDIFDKWKDYEEILRLHEIYIYPRHPLSASKTSDPSAKRSFSNSGLSAKSVSGSFSEERQRVIQPKAVFLNDAPYFDISSTEIREKRK